MRDKTWLGKLGIFALLVLGSACESGEANDPETLIGFSDGDTPRDGVWEGDFIDFTMENGVITTVTVHGVACSESDPSNPFIKSCTSDVVEGEFDEGLDVTGEPNYFTNEPEWRVSGSILSVQQIEGLFMPLTAEPKDFNSVAGTFFLDASGCECGGKINFITHFIPPPEPVPVELEEGDEATYGTTTPGGHTQGGDGGTADVIVPADTTEPQLAALNHVNVFREMVGVPLINGNEFLQAAASDHCACYALHKSEYGNMSPHSEDASWEPPCHGDLGARIQYSGYTGGSGYSEVMAFMKNPVNAVEIWMASVYHRLPLIDPASKDMGYGQDSQCDTINVGMGGAGGTWEAIYPIDGQNDVDTAWSGNEGPQPQIPPGGYPSGPVVTVQFGSGSFEIAEAIIENDAGESLPLTLLTPANDSYLGGDAIAFYTNAPLSAQSTYHVTVSGTVNNAPWEKSWSFTTGNGDTNW